MKLYNKTRYPSPLLERLLVDAGRAAGARTSDVVVIVTSSQPGYNRTRGMAHRACVVSRSALTHRRAGRNYDMRWVGTDGGYFRLTIPYPFLPTHVKVSPIRQAWIECHRFDGLTIAESIFSVATHEWRHIAQYQDNRFDFRDHKERRKRHDNRAWEKDAIKAASRSVDKPRSGAQDSILALALWIEEVK